MKATIWAALIALALGLPALGQTVPTDRNMLGNSSFEAVQGGLPSGWQWSPGAAHATLTSDEGAAHSGSCSVKIVNPTAKKDNVYGRMSTGVRLTVGRTYTLSCYVKSADPGQAWIGAGSKWQFRFAFPKATEWTRVSGTFVADTAQQDVMVVSESSTAGLWVDDVQLEPGDQATPYLFPATLQPGQSELRVLQGDWVSLAPNMIANSSFETLEGGMPKGWSFDRRNTDATMAIDETVAHSGKRSLRLTNGTAFGAHVYGMLSYVGGVQVKPDKDYTISCYVRSDGPGTAWIGGGPGWRIRKTFPRTTTSWTRVSISFRAEESAEGFPLLVITESPTQGIWIDDVKFEQGSEPTLYIADEQAEAAQVVPVAQGEVIADQSAEFGTWLFVPRALDKGSVQAELRSDTGARLASTTWEGPLDKGVAYAALRWGVTRGEVGNCSLTVTLKSGGETLASGTSPMTIHTVAGAEQQLEALRKRTTAGKELLAQARAKGFDGAYPLVGLTVAENFCDFVADDLAHREVLRAEEQLASVAAILDRVERELGDLLSGRRKELVAPRYVTSPIEIQGTSSVATVRWPDGREERRPVFFTGYGHFASVKRDLEKLPAYGLNFLQVEVGPSSTVRSEDKDDPQAIEDFAGLLQRGADANVAENLLLSPHYFPQWAYAKWPQVGGVKGGFLRFSIDAPEARSVLERHLRLTSALLKGKPALHSYCLSNEPIYLDPSADPCNKTKWAAWLKDRYQTVQAMNAAYGATYDSFDSVPVMPPGTSQPNRLYYDWCRFNMQRFAEWHSWMASVVHEVDPAMPVHAKTMNTHFSYSQMNNGVDAEQFCDLSQIAGNDSAKWFNHGSGDWANGWQAQNMHFDLQRSLRGQPIFNSENHVIIDRDLAYVPGVHIRNVLWQGSIHGEGASTMWVWERTFDKQSDFAGSIMHRPECAEAHGRVALDLMRLAPEVTAFQQAPARVAVVYSIASLIYGTQESTSDLLRAYHALNFCGEKIDFITERQLSAGKAKQYQVILAPGITHLPEDALRGLAAYDGLVLTTSAKCLSRDDFDRPQTVGMPKRLHVLPSVSAVELRDALLPLLKQAGVTPLVTVRDSATGQVAWGVEWQTVPTTKGLLVNLVNYMQKPQTVRLEGLQGTPVNLFADGATGSTIDLAPLEPVLLRVGK